MEEQHAMERSSCEKDNTKCTGSAKVELESSDFLPIGDPEAYHSVRSEGMDTEFILNVSHKGIRSLTREGFTYRISHSGKTILSWRCNTRGCPAVIKTDPGISKLIVDNTRAHIHRADQSVHAKMKIRFACKRRARDELNTSHMDIIRQETQRQGSGVQLSQQDIHHLQRAMYRIRRASRIKQGLPVPVRPDKTLWKRRKALSHPAIQSGGAHTVIHNPTSQSELTNHLLTADQGNLPNPANLLTNTQAGVSHPASHIPISQCSAREDKISTLNTPQIYHVNPSFGKSMEHYPAQSSFCCPDFDALDNLHHKSTKQGESAQQPFLQEHIMTSIEGKEKAQPLDQVGPQQTYQWASRSARTPVINTNQFGQSSELTCPEPGKTLGDNGTSHDSPEDERYFKCYSDVRIHEDMLSDKVRTMAYRRALHENRDSLQGATVLDVGAGTGILSHFAAQAGAKKVYAVEASAMAVYAKKIVTENLKESVITVLQSKVESADIPGPVDSIVSEWMGYSLLYESMLSSLLVARDRFLKPNGLMFPSSASLFLAPVADDEVYARVETWKNMKSLYGVSMDSMASLTAESLSARAESKHLEMDAVLATPHRLVHLDLPTVTLQQATSIQSTFSFLCYGENTLHAFSVWFSVGFPGTVTLDTSPYALRTHWGQTVLYLKSPLEVRQDTQIAGTFLMHPQHDKSRQWLISIEFQVSGSRKQHQQWLCSE